MGVVKAAVTHVQRSRHSVRRPAADRVFGAADGRAHDKGARVLALLLTDRLHVGRLALAPAPPVRDEAADGAIVRLEGAAKMAVSVEFQKPYMSTKVLECILPDGQYIEDYQTQYFCSAAPVL